MSEQRGQQTGPAGMWRALQERVEVLTRERDEARAALREAGEMVHLLSHPLEGPFHRCRATFCRRALGEPDGRVDVERVDVLARP